MLLRENRTNTSCAVTLVRTHMTDLLLDGAAHVSQTLTGMMLPPRVSAPALKVESRVHAMQDVSMCKYVWERNKEREAVFTFLNSVCLQCIWITNIYAILISKNH